MRVWSVEKKNCSDSWQFCQTQPSYTCQREVAEKDCEQDESCLFSDLRGCTDLEQRAEVRQYNSLYTFCSFDCPLQSVLFSPVCWLLQTTQR